MSANDPWFFDIEADTLGGERRSAQIVFVDADFRAIELRTMMLLLDHAEVPTIHIDQVEHEEMLVPGTLVYGDKLMQVFGDAREYYREFKQSIAQMMSQPLSSNELQTYALPRLFEPMPVNRTPKPMKEPHRSDWAQRRPRRRRRR